MSYTNYVKVPIGMINEGIKEDKYLMCTYLYSAIKSDKRFGYVVDTNLQHIVETFKPNEDSRKGEVGKFRNSLKRLEGSKYGYESIKVIEGSIDGDKGKILKYKFIDRYVDDMIREKEKESGREKEKESRTAGGVTGYTGYAKIDMEEVVKLIEGIKERNRLRSEKGGNKIDVCQAVNVYVYIEGKKKMYENMGGKFFESEKRIGEALGMGDKSVRKALKEIREIVWSGKENDKE